MSDILTPQKHLSLMVDDANEHELITKIARALSVKERVMILKDILTCSKNIPTIAKELNIPESSVTRHVDVLADGGANIRPFIGPFRARSLGYCTRCP